MAVWNLYSEIASPSQPQFPRLSTTAATHTATHGTWRVEHFWQSSTWVYSWWTCTATKSQRFVCQACHNLFPGPGMVRLHSIWLRTKSQLHYCWYLGLVYNDSTEYLHCIFIRPHRMHMYVRPIATDVARVCVCLSVCLCVGHTGVLCKSGWTDRDAVWRRLTHVDPRNHVLDGRQNRTNPFAATRDDKSAI